MWSWQSGWVSPEVFLITTRWHTGFLGRKNLFVLELRLASNMHYNLHSLVFYSIASSKIEPEFPIYVESIGPRSFGIFPTLRLIRFNSGLFLRFSGLGSFVRMILIDLLPRVDGLGDRVFIL
jgi:hypothetical protein